MTLKMIYEKFLSLTLLDRTLFSILCGLIALKLIKEIVFLSLDKITLSKVDLGPCRSLSEGQHRDCKNVFFRNRYFVNNQNRCPRVTCSGYRPVCISASELIESHRMLSFSLKFMDWGIQLTSTLLIFRTLLMGGQ